MIRKILIAIGSTVLAAGIMACFFLIPYCVKEEYFNIGVIVLFVALTVGTVAKVFYDLFTKD